MTILAAPPINLTAEEPTRHRITVAEFEQMIAADVWSEDERLELIEGELINMSPINVPHTVALRALTEILMEQLNRRAVLDSQSPIRLGDGSRPQPDLCLLHPPRSAYHQRLPQAADVLLLVEISDSSLRYDREVKLPRYALANIPEVWLVDLAHAQVLVFTQPLNGRYTQTATYLRTQTLAPTAFPEVVVNLDEVLVA